VEVRLLAEQQDEVGRLVPVEDVGGRAAVSIEPGKLQM
jgi:hypothetical protein